MPCADRRAVSGPVTITFDNESARNSYKDFSICDSCFRAQPPRVVARLDGFASWRPDGAHAWTGDPESHQAHRSYWNDPHSSGDAVFARIWPVPYRMGASHTRHHAKFQAHYPGRYADDPRRADQQSARCACGHDRADRPGEVELVGAEAVIAGRLPRECGAAGGQLRRFSRWPSFFIWAWSQSAACLLQPAAAPTARRIAYLPPPAALQWLRDYDRWG